MSSSFIPLHSVLPPSFTPSLPFSISSGDPGLFPRRFDVHPPPHSAWSAVVSLGPHPYVLVSACSHRLLYVALAHHACTPRCRVGWMDGAAAGAYIGATSPGADAKGGIDQSAIEADGRDGDEGEFGLRAIEADAGEDQVALIVNSIISDMFSNSTADLESALPDTVPRLVTDQPQDFDSPDPFNHPLYILSMKSLIQFVLVPHVTARIIEQDMNVQYMDAVDIKDDSAEYGDMFYRPSCTIL
ncbi:hypothetical protein B0H13DRAFT_2346966 [Mycena leptocephala]|nr:hypothetical protein B0H13DRAFT_2346966 [Mycena leptocephala]